VLDAIIRRIYINIQHYLFFPQLIEKTQVNINLRHVATISKHSCVKLQIIELQQIQVIRKFRKPTFI